MLLCLLFCFVSLIKSSSVFPCIHFSPACEFLVIVHTAKTSLLRCCLHTTVGYSRPPSAVNDLSATKIENNKINSWKPFVWGFTQRSVDNGLPLSITKPLHAASFMDFLCFLRKTTRIHSIATKWRKNSVTVAVAGNSSMAWAWVVVLQILGVNGLVQTTLGWSQNGFSMVRQCFLTYWERSPNFVCNESILIRTFERWNLVLQDHP